MRGLAVMGALVAGGCFSPAPPAGGACAAGERCPEPLVCDPASNTCVAMTTSGDDAGDDAVGDDATAPPDAGGPPVNDHPGGAIDVSAGGTFEVDLTLATDDGDGSCGAPGGRDVFYELAAPAGEVVYVDTIGSEVDALVTVLDGRCADRPGELTCLDDVCGSQAQGAGQVTGPICLVVDEARGAREIAGRVVLHVGRGGRPGIALPDREGVVVGSTIDADNLTAPECDGDSLGAGDAGYFFTLCDDETVEVYADTCSATPYDSWLSIRAGDGVSGSELACLDDGCGADGDDAFVLETVTGPGLYWILVDGYADERGDYALSYAIAPP